MLPHDLLEANEARAVLNMPQAKFELLVSSGQLPLFRSSGRTCFRREDIAALALKRRAAAWPVESVSTPARKSPAKLQRVPSSPALAAAGRDEDPSPPIRSTSARGLAAIGVMLSVLIATLMFLKARSSGSGRIELTAPLAAPAPAFKAAPGLVESASGERPLSFEVAGKLRAVFVEEGQSVKAGDRIAELENTDLVAKLLACRAAKNTAEAKCGILQGDLDSDLAKAKTEVARWKAELDLLEPRLEDIEQAEAEVRALQADADRAAEDAQRYSDKENSGKSWSIQLTEQTRHLAESAQAKLDSSAARLRALKSGARPADRARARALLAGAEAEVARHALTDAFRIASAHSEAEQARAQVDQVQAELAKTRIVASIDGTVVRAYMHPGEVVDALHPQAVVTLADLAQLRVRADVDEADFAQIRVGEHVKISADVLDDGAPLSGTVERVSAMTGQKRFSTGDARERMDVKIVETVVKFDAPPPAKLMKLGLRVTALFDITSSR